MGDTKTLAQGEAKGDAAGSQLASEGKQPRTPRGQKTMRKILDAALGEFGERGFSESSIVGITSRAKVALGTFYTYFDSKEAVFAALVGDMSGRVRDHVAPALVDATDGLDGERLALEAYLGFVKDHKEVYRIIDEAEFVDPAGFRAHYETTASRIAGRLQAAAARGEIEGGDALANEVRAWSIMGMNVFLGLRFGVWGNEPPSAVAAEVNRLLRRGLER
ncbi:MAG: TetR/AcrR family transcriptional regulator [Pseudomonadota bacterium]